MSPLWKSELTVRLGRDDCCVQWRSAWRRAPIAEASATGTASDALGSALATLRDSGHGALPRSARLLVPDERVYLNLVPAVASPSLAHKLAGEHFTALLGRQDLVVQVADLPSGRWALAAAIEAADLAAWQTLFDAHGLGLASVELALLHDLAAIAGHVEDEMVVALLREEGVTLLRLAAGSPVEVSWERCDPQSQHCIEQRLLAFLKTGEVGKASPLLLLCRSAEQHDLWQRLAKAHRWTTLTPRPRAAGVAA